MKKNTYGVSPETVAVLLNPTLEGAMQFWDRGIHGDPIGDAPLAGIHKARLKWPASTKVMVKESKKWLLENGYGINKKGPSPNVRMAKKQPVQ